MRSWPVGAGTPVAGDEHEPRLVAGVVGEVGGDHVEPVHLGGDPRGERGARSAISATRASRVGRAVRGEDLRLGQVLAQVAVALRGGDRDRMHLLDVGERHARPGQQAVLDVDHDLADDQQLVVECERVLGEVDHPLDRVLDRHETEVDLTGLHRVEHVGHGPVRHVLRSGQIGEGLQRLFGERAERTEEADTLRHGRSGYVSDPITWHDESVDEATLRQLVDDVRSGTVSPDDAVERLRRLPFADVEGASVDHHRHLRQGVPEAIYGPGKQPEDCARIVAELLEHGTGPVLLTRSTPNQRERVSGRRR